METKAGATPLATTSNSVLVILANFSNTVAPAYTATQAQQVMTTNSNSVANFYNEVSYGQQTLNVTVTSSWVTMNLTATSVELTWDVEGFHIVESASPTFESPIHYPLSSTTGSEILHPLS